MAGAACATHTWNQVRQPPRPSRSNSFEQSDRSSRQPFRECGASLLSREGWSALNLRAMAHGAIGRLTARDTRLSNFHFCDLLVRVSVVVLLIRETLSQ